MVHTFMVVLEVRDSVERWEGVGWGAGFGAGMGGGGLNFPRFTRCIQHSVLNMVHTFMVVLEVRDSVERWEGVGWGAGFGAGMGGGGGLNFPRFTRCIQHSVLNMVHTFMVVPGGQR